MQRGDRVKIAAWTDTFMRGERYGEVLSVGHKWITVRGERSGLKFKFKSNGWPTWDSDALELAEPYKGAIRT